MPKRKVRHSAFCDNIICYYFFPYFDEIAVALIPSWYWSLENVVRKRNGRLSWKIVWRISQHLYLHYCTLAPGNISDIVRCLFTLRRASHLLSPPWLWVVLLGNVSPGWICRRFVRTCAECHSTEMLAGARLGFNTGRLSWFRLLTVDVAEMQVERGHQRLTCT